MPRKMTTFTSTYIHISITLQKYNVIYKKMISTRIVSVIEAVYNYPLYDSKAAKDNCASEITYLTQPNIS